MCLTTRGLEELLYTLLRIPTMRLYNKTRTAITSKMWIKEPTLPTSHPSSQRTSRMTTTAQRTLANDITCIPFMSDWSSRETFPNEGMKCHPLLSSRIRSSTRFMACILLYAITTSSTVSYGCFRNESCKIATTSTTADAILWLYEEHFAFLVRE